LIHKRRISPALGLAIYLPTRPLLRVKWCFVHKSRPTRLIAYEFVTRSASATRAWEGAAKGLDRKTFEAVQELRTHVLR